MVERSRLYGVGVLKRVHQTAPEKDIKVMASNNQNIYLQVSGSVRDVLGHVRQVLSRAVHAQPSFYLHAFLKTHARLGARHRHVVGEPGVEKPVSERGHPSVSRGEQLPGTRAPHASHVPQHARHEKHEHRGRRKQRFARRERGTCGSCAHGPVSIPTTPRSCPADAVTTPDLC